MVERSAYKPYGEQTEWLSASQPAPETKGWIGERFDAGAGLQYLNARYYDPVLGMFLQPDWWEVKIAGVGPNRFGYCSGDPVGCTDPSGHKELPDPSRGSPAGKKGPGDWYAHERKGNLKGWKDANSHNIVSVR